MEGTTRHRRPGRDTQGGRDSRSQEYESNVTKRNMLLEETEDRHPSDRWRRRVFQNREGSQCKGALSGQGQEGKGFRQKWGRSPHSSPSIGHRDSEHWREQRGRQPTAAQGSWKDKHNSPSARGHPREDSAHTPRYLKGRRSLSRRPVKTTSRRRQDSPETRPPSPKRGRPTLSAEAPEPLAGLPSRLFTHLGALEETLAELRVPGGAFLRVPGAAGATQPSASQRAWLTWQLAHAGATLHWALATLDSLLAAQPWFTAPQSRPAAPQPWPAALQPCMPWSPWSPWR